MKVFVAVALFAFVALQLSNAAPVPDEEKKEEPAVPITPAEATSPAAAASEVKAESPSVEPSTASKVETPAPAEEKKA